MLLVEPNCWPGQTAQIDSDLRKRLASASGTEGLSDGVAIPASLQTSSGSDDMEIS